MLAGTLGLGSIALKRPAPGKVSVKVKILRCSIIIATVQLLEKCTGCPKSHYTKVRAYCSACDHLICKISSRMFQKSSSFEEFNGFSEIDVHFFE